MRETLNEFPVRQREERRSPDDGDQDGLWVRFFGDFEVFHGDAILDLGRNTRSVSLFKYLLARSPHPVSRDWLIGWLWPESNPRKARWSLHSAVYNLRKVLDNSPTGEGLSGLVVLDAGRYRLSREVRVSSDAVEFEACHERGRLLERSGRVEEAVREYEDAVSLYRDDYLAEDLYEDWTMIERERLCGAYVDLLERLTEHYMRRGELQTSAELCYRVLEKSPHHEESYRRLMRCYSRLGLRGRATNQYELCNRVLGRLYGMVPSEETRGLHERVLRGEKV